ncbi:modular polyketide synthase [Alloactinosynnema sp. L-07]|nr:type I polyketide synthase [Alloactinosynnema sp. L-07]CRK56359.1 modular polyketide synthase [Alloactinosynnema sp. L-07]
MVSGPLIGISPFGGPDARLVAALSAAGAVGVLDLGAGDRRAMAELDRVTQWTSAPFGVRLADCSDTPDLPDQVDLVVLGGDRTDVATFAGRRVLVEVTSLAQARSAVAAGASGVIARGHEAGGRVGELSSFVLLQHLLDAIDVPVWLCGGIGPQTAAAAVVGGAAGVVIDTQLALLREAGPLPAGAAGLRGMDGSETVVVDGRRVLRARPFDHGGVAEVGQDGYLADEFARAFGDVGGVVRAFRAALDDALRPESALGANSVLAGRLGTRLPVVQGPMTRVSDRPELAAAVAAEGGLPFLALALADAETSRSMLADAARELGDQPWGAGILGFAPEETRAAQLAVIQQVRPTSVIIAGGRPAQAASLEAAGIATFLHVPSPRLLTQFLDAGARRFVFEGAECGGHIGPRSSFCLWQAQITTLVDFLDARPGIEIDVLFAGGIHDARSSAMVAAMAAPLTLRGAGVGVLMGTGYLFTEEAVRGGAIGATFQDQVVAADSTAVLETAPGHQTRCVESPFTAEFERTRDRLREKGTPDREIWEELEKLNIGRLRVASKGIRRDGADLVPVDAAGQLADGLFMAGQVAVLRDAVTTVAELHHDVTAGAREFLAERVSALSVSREPVAVEAPAPLDIAIVGMAGVFPGAPDTAAFWANVLAGVDSVTEVPADRWDPAVHYSPAGGGETVPSKWGGFLPLIPFDALAYGIPPASLAAIEPVQLVALEVAQRALIDAGYAGAHARPFDRSRTAVVFGAESGGELSNAAMLRAMLPGYLAEVPADLTAQLPQFTEDTFPGVLANVISGRIANRLDLGGANFTVDAACASSLAALDVACRELVSGNADLALCGGADTHNGIYDYRLFASVGALSPTGRSRTFDSSADGIALSEGVGCVVLKRLDDAVRDGDQVYAVIRGIGSSSDGRSLGLTAPRPDGQRVAMARAYANARRSPAEVGLIEAHGTGTAVGDRTELATLTSAFEAAGAEPGGTVLGSVKSQIGHTKCAAGVAGLIKTALAVHTGTRPPTSHLTSPATQWSAETSPFAFNTEARPWAAPPAERVAGISGFGFGGTNFHAVLTGHAAPAPRHGLDQWPAELFLLRGESDRSWLRDLVKTHPHGRLRDFARTAARRFGGGQAVAAFVATDVADLLRSLDSVSIQPERERPAVAVLFPGQGSQRVGMGADLFVAFPELQALLADGRRWADALYPGAAFTQDAAAAQRERLRDTRVAQPALGLADLAAFEFLGLAGVDVDMVGGHSYGELVALAAAGVLRPADLLDLSVTRAELILAAAGDDPGAMAAVSASADMVARVIDGTGVVIANHNSPTQVVISGSTTAVADAMERLRVEGLSAKRIPVACAFHSPVVAAAGDAFAAAVSARATRAPEIPVWSNRTASRYPEDIAVELGAQIGSPVRFADQIAAMHDDGARVFIECGPGRVLSGLVAATLAGRPHRTVHFGDGLAGALSALAALAEAGVPLRPDRLYHGRDALDLTSAPAAVPARWTVDGQAVRTAAGQIIDGGVRPARQIAVGSATPRLDPDALVSDYFRTTREFVAAQRDVLLAYFGADGVPAPVRPARPAEVPAAEPLVIEAPAVRSVDTITEVATLISERTGYPVEMIEPDLDLEADLSIDSIKRTELVGELAVRLGEGQLGDGVVEELAKLRTTGEIATWIDARREPVAEPVADALRIVIGVISERTGYPTEMIEPDLDLEADLSIDSIKRTELIGELATRFRGGHLDDGAMEALSRIRTAAGLAEWIEGGTAQPAAPAAEVEAPKGVAPTRYLLTPVPAPATPTGDLTGRKFVVAGLETPVGQAIRVLFAEHGAEIVDDLATADGLLDLEALAAAGADDDPTLLPEVFPRLRDAALTTGMLVAVTSGPVGRAAGLRGFFRSVARECPDATIRLVEVDPGLPAAEVAHQIAAELRTVDQHPVVRVGVERSGFTLVEAGLGALAAAGGGPDGQGGAEAAAMGLGRDSVLLMIGGARGITARFAATAAAASGCRIVLAGRTALTGDPDTLAATDLAGVRSALAASGLRDPAELDRTARRVLARREVEATIADLRALGSEVRYTTVDATDGQALHDLVKQVHTDHGRLDGVVFAAGVIEDRLLRDKTVDSFRRVFATKVDGARALFAAVGDLPGFVVLFGSIAAVLGNRGQTDYAAANDALESLGAEWAARTGRRALTVHWGPWAPDSKHGGMVTRELAADYARRDIGLIDPEEGALSLLRELAWGTDPAVVHTASGW